ncbi:MAG: citramalate synthase [Solirubrobacteraceae bacterium]
MSNTIQLYDATLRDGMQGEGMSLSAEEKLRVAHALDELGVELIEAGFPESNPKERELFELLTAERFENAEIAAFGMTRRRGIAASEDAGLVLLAESVAPVCTIVGKTWALHLEKIVKVDRAENLRMIAESVEFLRAQGKRVIYDSEHFFDGWRDDPAYAIACIEAAAEGGAETVCLCDTNGSSLPSQIAMATSAAVTALGERVRLGIHCHNDAECGVANTLAAVEVGARQVQGTVNGIGERTGNANLISIIANLQLKLGFECLGDEQLARLTSTAHFVDELLNVTPNANQPYVGRHAFAHKGGMHVAGVSADASTFEHVDPAVVGNERTLVVSELAGRASMLEKAASFGLELDDQAAARVLERVKRLEHEGYQFEAADGSLELLLRRETGDYEPLFELESWRVVVASERGAAASTEATIRIRIDGREYERSAMGNGPVNALDSALRAAIVEVYPHLGEVELVNYKVRILDVAKGTGAVTRVLIDASDGSELWGTIGVSENVIAASWQALVDSLECAMLPSRVK